MNPYLCVIQNPIYKYHNDYHWVHPFESLVFAANTKQECLGRLLEMNPTCTKHDIEIFDIQALMNGIDSPCVVLEDFADGE